MWSVDDHSADSSDSADPSERKAVGDAIARAWDNPATHVWQAEDQRLANGLSRPDRLLEMYRAYNAPGSPALTYQSDFGAALVEPSQQQFGRGYVGYWEARNLRMAANMRDVLGRYPGMRLLVIVGASHKGYYVARLSKFPFPTC